MLTRKKTYSRPNNFTRLLAFLLALGLWATTLLPALAQIPTNFAAADFQALWSRTDYPVYSGAVSRSYVWGPQPNTGGLQEDYAEAPGGKRRVQYFDKSRMEITHPDADRGSPYYVTNGLVTRELMSGLLQLGDNKFEQRRPAEIGVAGDADDTNGPTYRTMNSLTQPVSESGGNRITKAIDRAGNQRDGTSEFGQYGIKGAKFEPATGHNIAEPFWNYLNQTGPIFEGTGSISTGRIFEPVYYATGLPTTEAWWSKVKVGGVVKDVLVQAFERRILTYTPANPAAYRVEMGNVGQHYYLWRYGGTPPSTNNSAKCNPTQPLVSASLSLDARLTFSALSSGQQTLCVAVNKGGQAVVGAKVNFMVYYKSTSSTFQGDDTGGDGRSLSGWDIGNPTKGYEVKVEVVVQANGESAKTVVSWTPN